MRGPIAPAGLLAGVLLCLSAGAASAQPPAPAPDRFLGAWQGALDVGGGRLRLGLEVARDSVGGLRGVLTSIDQGNQKIPATVAVRGDSLVVDVPLASVVYAAVLVGDSLRGTFRQGPGALPLAMGRTTGVAAAPPRPQEPKPPFPYRTEEVTVESRPGVRLAGTLSVPEGAGPFPAVVLVTGSGPQDRDESLMGHKPFLVLTDHLARHGIASLRLDDRGVGKSTGSFAAATSDDFADDAEAAVRFLRARAGIARDRVGIVGHSEGGLVAPLVASRSRDVAFVVLLAGPGVPGDSILMLQTRALLASTGADSAMIARPLALNRRVYDAVLAGGDSAAIAGRVTAIVDEQLAPLPEATRAQVAASMRQQMIALTSPWFRHFLAYDPRPALRRVKVPVLALDGTLDLQVPYRENLAAIEAALKEGGNRAYRMAPMPGLNHLFQTATTGAPGEYAAIQETMSPAVLDLVSGWIAEQARRR